MVTVCPFRRPSRPARLAVCMVVAFSLVVLFDLSYPFSGDVKVDPGRFETGGLAQFFQHNR